MLEGFHVLEIGPGCAAAVAGRAFADLGAEVETRSADSSTTLAYYLGLGKKDCGKADESAALAAAPPTLWR